MNLDRTVFWIRLIAWAILDILNGLDGGPEEDEETVGDVTPWFKPERIQVWIGVLAEAALKAVDEVGAPPAERPGAQSAGLWPSFKPERIQFWLKLIAQFVLAVVDAMSPGKPGGTTAALAGEETGKSGEPGSGAPDPEEAGW